MQINVNCPECRTSYPFPAEYRGRKMRCTNPSCQATFIIEESGRPTARIANALGELVPANLKSYPIPQPKPKPIVKPKVEEYDWRHAPPPVQDADEVTQPAYIERKKPRSSRPAPIVDDEHHPPTRRRRGLFLTLLFLLVAGGAVGFAGWKFYDATIRRENDARAEAEKDYKDGKLAAAEKKYRELTEQFPRSEHHNEDLFMVDLCAAREPAARVPAEPEAAFTAMSPFLTKNAKDAMFKPHRGETVDSLAAIVKAFIESAAAAVVNPAEFAGVPALLARAREALSLFDLHSGRSTDVAEFRGQIDKIQADYAAAFERKAAIERVLALLKPPKPDIDAAESLIRRAKIENDPAVRAALAAAKDQLNKLVVYEPLNKAALPVGPADGPSSLLPEPFDAPPTTSPSGDVVLAVARGLLWALDARDGRRLWTARVGLDAAGLPIRVPARAGEPELVIVAGTEPPGLTARDLRTGLVRWHQPLEASALGRPVLDGGRLFVPTGGPRGLIYDFDARTGLARGRFEAGHPFAGGAAFDPTGGRLYVPAYGKYVYVFNYAPVAATAGPAASADPRCDGLLPTGHAPGSLRGEPVVVSGEEGVEVPRYLVLGEADGLGAMKLRAFRLLDRPDSSPPPAEVRLPGWSYFPPYADPEKLAVVTDAGVLGVFGIQQSGNADPPLFPFFGRDLPMADARTAARGLLVHADETGFWVLAGGTLQFWRLGLTRDHGRSLVAAWAPGPKLGSPLHAAQISSDHTTLYLVTQTDSPPGLWATAVDAKSGAIRWQRPLGLTVQGEPLLIGGAVLTIDPAGAVDRFDASECATGGSWRSGGRRVVKPAVELVGEPFLLPAADGQSAYALTCVPIDGGVRLFVRQIAADGTVREKMFKLAAGIAGTPAIGLSAAVLPLADGSLCRIALGGDETRVFAGPNWRGLGARPDAKGQVVVLGDDEFLVSDGSRRMFRLRWPAGPKYDLDTARPLDLPARLAMAPVRLPGAPPRVAVADVAGGLSLLTGDGLVRSWRLGGEITAGPWTVGDRIVCVVGRTKLVCLDPAQNESVWTWTASGDGVGSPPVVVDGKWVVADLSGAFVALDPATGKEVGRYQHPAEVAPTTAAARFGPGRLFAPLTDGSALLLQLNELK